MTDRLPLTDPVIRASLLTADDFPSKWWDKAADMATDIDSLPPIYYCRRCNWIEDGGHRIAAHWLGGHQTIPVEYHDECISPYNWLHSERHHWTRKEAITLSELPPSAFHDMLSNTEITQDRPKRDHDLLDHTAYKWGVITDKTSFRDRTVIDFGCHAGLSTIYAALSGASLALGVETRTDVTHTPKRIIERGRIDNCTIVNGWLPDFPTSSWDITMCLGVIHKFAAEKYETVLQYLAEITTEQLIIETMLDYREEPVLDERSGGGKWPITTYASDTYYSQELDRMGFDTTFYTSDLYDYRSFIFATRRQ